MTCSTYTKKGTVIHAIYIVFLSVLGLLAAYSAIFTFCRITCPEDRIVTGFTLFFATLILAVDFFECRAMAAQLYMNEDGLGVRHFKKTKVFIKWSDIREIGIGTIPTPFGRKNRVYFCDRELDEEEKFDLVTLKYHTVHFSYIPKTWYEKMSEHLPFPIAKDIADKYVK